MSHGSGASLARLARTGGTEVVLALILLLVELALWDVNVASWAILTPLALSGAAVLSGYYPRAGASASIAALVWAVALPDNALGSTLYAPMIAVLACSLRGLDLWARGSAALCFFISLAMTIHRAPGHAWEALLLWGAFYSLPLVLGLGLGRMRDRDREDLVARMAAQRRDIASELHDTLSHDLTVISLRAGVAQTVATDSKVLQELELIAELARRNSDRLRQLMDLLQIGEPSGLLALTQVLPETVEKLRQHGFEVQAFQSGDLRTIAGPAEDALSRILREATNNVIRHATASTPVELTLDIDRTDARLRVSNCALDQPPTPGLGLYTMRRIALNMAGSFTTQADDGRWTVDVSVPLR